MVARPTGAPVPIRGGVEGPSRPTKRLRKSFPEPPACGLACGSQELLREAIVKARREHMYVLPDIDKRVRENSRQCESVSSAPERKVIVFDRSRQARGEPVFKPAANGPAPARLARRRRRNGQAGQDEVVPVEHRGG